MASDTNALSAYLQGLYKIEPLPLAEEERLSKMIQHGDHAALEKLVRHNLRFVVMVIKETPAWHHGQVPFEDLLAMGNEALLRAAKKWVPKNGARFATYAKGFILRGVRRGIDNEWMLVRIPVNVAEEIRRMQYQDRRLTQQLGRQPTDEELADAIRVHVTRLTELRSMAAIEPVPIEDSVTEKYQEESEE
jgi:RNA polymerase primary sigma factor